MKNILFLIFSVLIFSCDSQDDVIQWDDLEKLTVFYQQNLSLKDSRNADSYDLESKQAKKLFQNSVKFDSVFLWKSYRLVKAKFSDGNEIFFKVSSYGEVFYDITNEDFYKFKDGTNTEFLFTTN